MSSFFFVKSAHNRRFNRAEKRFHVWNFKRKKIVGFDEAKGFFWDERVSSATQIRD